MKQIASNEVSLSKKGFGDRIKEERQRLKLNQAEFAALGGVSRPSQANYESEQRIPDLNYLSRLCGKVDVMYILTGDTRAPALISAIVAPAVQLILSEIDLWARESQRQLTEHFRAELMALFLQQLVTNGKIDPPLIKNTLRLIK